MRKTVTIGDLGTIITGNTPPRDHPELYGNHTPFVKATDISETEKFTYNPEECYSKEGYDKYIRSLVPKGSTCVVTIGSIGKKMTMAHCDMFINQAMNAIIPNENFDKEFVYYAVKNVLPNIKGLDSGTASGRENVSKSAFSKMEVLVDDDIEIQHRIATILSRYDTLIENYQKQIKLLEEAAQLLYKEWFVDLRFPGYEHTKVVDGVPEGWEVVSVGDLVSKLESGSRPKGGIDASIKDGVASVGAENVIGLGRYNFSSEKLVSYDFYNNAKKGKIENKDILIYKDGAYIGRTSLFQDGFPHRKAMVNEHVFLLHAKNEVDQYFLFFTLYQSIYFEKMQKLNKNAAQPGINQDAIRSLTLLKPSNELIVRFDKFISGMTKKLFNYAYQIRLLTEARDRLLPKLMRGEINLTQSSPSTSSAILASPRSSSSLITSPRSSSSLLDSPTSPKI